MAAHELWRVLPPASLPDVRACWLVMADAWLKVATDLRERSYSVEETCRRAAPTLIRPHAGPRSAQLPHLTIDSSSSLRIKYRTRPSDCRNTAMTRTVHLPSS